MSRVAAVARFVLALILFSAASMTASATIILLGFHAIAGRYVLPLALAVAAGVGLGMWALPRHLRTLTPPAARRRVPPSMERFERLADPFDRNIAIARLEQLMELPARIPPHEAKIRPPVPPADRPSRTEPGA